MKISIERLLAESSRLQDHRQRNCVIRSVTVESAVLSGRHVKTNVDVYARSSLIPEYTDPSDKTVQCDEDTCWLWSQLEHEYTIRCLTGSQWRLSQMVLVMWSNYYYWTRERVPSGYEHCCCCCCWGSCCYQIFNSLKLTHFATDSTRIIKLRTQGSFSGIRDSVC